jgi:hypothetical protein
MTNTRCTNSHYQCTRLADALPDAREPASLPIASNVERPLQAARGQVTGTAKGKSKRLEARGSKR